MYRLDYKDDKEIYQVLPLVEAFESVVFFVSCDAFTHETLSKSYICHPQRILEKIEGKEGIIFADLDLNEIDSLRKYYDHEKAL